MMKVVNDVFNWLVGGGATVIFVIGGTIAVKAWPLIHEILDHKEATVKNVRTKQHYEQLEQWAGIAVAAVSTNLDAMGSDKKKEAIRIVNTQLADHKIDINIENVANAVEAAYQAFKASQPTTVKVSKVATGIDETAVKPAIDTDTTKDTED